jgi:hypothetical protein
VGHVNRVYGVTVLESKVNDLRVYGMGHVYRFYGMKLLESVVNGLWI